jgi:hypothetical protein
VLSKFDKTLERLIFANDSEEMMGLDSLRTSLGAVKVPLLGVNGIGLLEPQLFFKKSFKTSALVFQSFSPIRSANILRQVQVRNIPQIWSSIIFQLFSFATSQRNFFINSI